ncbi:hypothetical protein Btru_016735 [Bulinus truncatus]|nr:hypothetical protein Btru_016735 [Bulinus truncatus]
MTTAYVDPVMINSGPDNQSDTTTSGMYPSLSTVDDLLPEDGQAEDLFSYFADSIKNLLGGGEQTHNTAENCKAAGSLKDVCGDIPPSVTEFFEQDLSVQGLLNALFLPDIVESLQSQCVRGAWCLSADVHKRVLETTDRLYIDAPICSNAYWTCLENFMTQRYNCDDVKQLRFFVSTTELLCKMQLQKNLTRECYARTLETLYVTYSDMSHPVGSLMGQLTTPGCNTFRTWMANTYLCAYDSCSGEQKVLLEDFNVWNGMPSKANSILQDCNVTKQCQELGDEARLDHTPPYVPQLTSTTYSYGFEEEEEEEELIEEEYENQLKIMEDEIEQALKDAENAKDSEETTREDTNLNDSKDDDSREDTQNLNVDGSKNQDSVEDTTVMYGLITVTVVMLVGLVGVAFIGFKRYRRSRYSSLRRGYSLLSEEESKILRHEYN